MMRLCTASLCLLLFSVGRLPASAQCPPLDAKVKGWPKGTTVRYDLSFLPPDLRPLAQQAFAAWNNANATNGSGVRFEPADDSNPPTYLIQVGEARDENGAAVPAVTSHALN